MLALALAASGGDASRIEPARLLKPLPVRLVERHDQRMNKGASSATLELLIDPKGGVAGCTMFDMVEPPGARPGRTPMPCLTLTLTGKFAPAVDRDGHPTWGVWRWAFRLDEDGILSSGDPVDLADVQVTNLPSSTDQIRVQVILDVKEDGTVQSCEVAGSDEGAKLASFACPGLLFDQPTLRVVRRKVDGPAVRSIRQVSVRFSRAE